MIAEFQDAAFGVRAWVRIDVPAASLMVVKRHEATEWLPVSIHVVGDDPRILGPIFKHGMFPKPWMAELDALEAAWRDSERSAA